MDWANKFFAIFPQVRDTYRYTGILRLHVRLELVAPRQRRCMSTLVNPLSSIFLQIAATHTTNRCGSPYFPLRKIFPWVVLKWDEKKTEINKRKREKSYIQIIDNTIISFLYDARQMYIYMYKEQQIHPTIEENESGKR